MSAQLCEFKEIENENVWRISLKQVKKIGTQDFIEDMKKEVPNYTYVAVYLQDLKDKKSLHCVYVQDIALDKITNEFKWAICLNSHGNNTPNPSIPIRRPDVTFHRIWCDVQKSSLQTPSLLPPKTDQIYMSQTLPTNASEAVQEFSITRNYSQSIESGLDQIKKKKTSNPIVRFGRWIQKTVRD